MLEANVAYKKHVTYKNKLVEILPVMSNGMVTKYSIQC